MLRGRAATPRTPFEREHSLARMVDETFDVLVVGGGITGAGVALDAAARGLRTGLVEAQDFASGTSSRSSKLVHGGLRYLQQGEFRLVYEALAERQRLLDNAPHLVSPLPFVIPLFGSRGAFRNSLARLYSIALWEYDLTGGLRIGKRHRRIGPEDAQRYLPSLDTERLAAAFLYWDAQADDARLTLTIARTAVVNFGAVAANHAPVVALLEAGDRVAGVRLENGAEVRAHAVVNATGVWSDRLQGMEDRGASPTIRPAKGIHLTFPAERLPASAAAVLPVASDRRSVFVVPWGGFTYAGTTDTDYWGPLDDPQCTPEDVAYVLDAINGSMTSPVTTDDVVASWAGLRPLVGSAQSERTADLSRRHRVTRSRGGVVTVTGGKLTTYRRMASDTVDQVVEDLGRGARRSPTKRLALLGAPGFETLRQPDAPARLGVEAGVLSHLASRYGTEARTVIALMEADPELGRPLVPGLPYLRAEAVYAARYEMAWTLEDVLARRTRASFLARDAAAAAAPSVARLIAPELGWSVADCERQANRYRESARRARDAAGLPDTSGVVDDRSGGETTLVTGGE